MDLHCGSVENHPKFVIRVPVSRRKFYLYIPVAFLEKFKIALPENLILRVRNGDIFEVKFNKYCNCFVGLDELFDRYGLKFTNFLIFEYFGENTFYVCITNYTAVEIEYPNRGTFHYFKNSSMEPIPIEEHIEDLLVSNVVHDINYTVLSMGNYGSRKDEFRIILNFSNIKGDEAVVIPSDFGCVSRDIAEGDSLLFLLNDKAWDVLVRSSPEGLILADGWLTFVNEVGLQIGDVCVLRKRYLQNKFLVGLYKGFRSTVEKVTWCVQYPAGALKPKVFVSIVDDESMCSGQIYVPLLFSELYLNEIPSDLVLFNGFGISFKAQYNDESSIISGVEQIMHQRDGCRIYLIVFNYEGNGVFRTTNFTKDGVDMVICC